MNLYLDIESIPSQREDIKQRISDTLAHPKTMSKPETIEKWENETKPLEVEKEWLKTGLNGAYGEIISIAWAWDDEPISCLHRRLESPEKSLLVSFVSSIKPADRVHRPVIWIGHNITFDTRFIWQRCIVNGVKPSIEIPYDAKPWSKEIFDTMGQWNGINRTSLDELCFILGIPGKGDMDGSKVWDAVKAGEYEKIVNYNKDDVHKARMIHKRLTFIGDK